MAGRNPAIWASPSLHQLKATVRDQGWALKSDTLMWDMGIIPTPAYDFDLRDEDLLPHSVLNCLGPRGSSLLLCFLLSLPSGRGRN